LYGQPPIFSLVVYLYLTMIMILIQANMSTCREKCLPWSTMESFWGVSASRILKQPQTTPSIMQQCSYGKINSLQKILAGVTTDNFFNSGNLLRHSSPCNQITKFPIPSP
jgi:hypothetical protein